MTEVTIDLSLFEQDMAEHEVSCECSCHDDERPAVAYWIMHCEEAALCVHCQDNITTLLTKHAGKACKCGACRGMFVMGPAHYRRTGDVK